MIIRSDSAQIFDVPVAEGLTMEKVDIVIENFRIPAFFKVLGKNKRANTPLKMRINFIMIVGLGLRFLKLIT